MTNSIKVTTANGSAYIRSPYNRDFVARVKALGGKWNADTRDWVIREESLEAARAAMMDIYGETDIPAAETVTVIAEFLRDDYADRGSYSLLGKTIAQAWGRDSGAKVGEGCAFVAGQPESGGSAKNWRTNIYAGSIVAIYDVPKDFAEREIPKINPDIIRLTIMGAPKLDRAALETERAMLIERLAKIDALLAQA